MPFPGVLSANVDSISHSLQDNLGYPYYVRTIFKQHQNIFTWLELQKKPEEMSYTELQTFIKEMTTIGAEVRKWIVELYLKISYPFANFIIIFQG